MPKANNKTNKKPTVKPRSSVKRIFYWAAVVGVWGVIALGFLLGVIAWGLPDVNEAISATKKPVVRVLSSDGALLAFSGDIYATPVDISDLPPALPQAILATEDRRFYNHFGIDPISIMRAAAVNIWSGGIRQGGSTITQQAAKNLFLKPERTFKRKAQETILALWLEAKFSKDQIFTIYLNRVYFGSGVYGVNAAAKYYFGVAAQNLRPLEAAMLAGMLKGPNKYNPITNPDLAMARAQQVLVNMVAAGYMNKTDANNVRAGRVRTQPPRQRRSNLARHFTDWVLGLAPDFITLDQDITVITTLDSKLQKKAEKTVAKWMGKNGPAMKANAEETAMLSIAPDGAVLAMVGGKNWRQNKFNHAVQASRQPGSAFKPVVFLAGLETGLNPGSTFSDEPITVDGWSPKNFNREYLGDITMSQALERSINTVAVKISEHAGREKVKNAARRLGISGRLTSTPSLALGVDGTTLLELTSAYGVFANGGFGIWPYAINEIKDSSGQTIYARSGSGLGRMVKPEHVKQMRSMLERVIIGKKGTGKKARLGYLAAGKTGTSQGYRDAWFIGFTPNLITGVWVGNDNSSPMKNVTGGSIPAQMWKDYMARATEPANAWRKIPVDDRRPSDVATPRGPNIFEQLFESIFGK
ncbi:MAG: PBP1A family penicillin-binding protein [Rhodospirillaceae bacterium]|nr:PBP1A family penicillin-binding protein [Rhodospirillaceae bacterium]